jgi:general secretion pathway protein O
MMFALTALIFPLGFPLLGAWILLSFLLTLAVIDHHTQLLPDVLTLPLLWIGLLFNIQGHFAPLEQATIGAVAGYVCLWSVFWLFKLATGKEALGYGDFKLLAALGAWLGWQALPQVILVAAASGLLVTLIQRGLAKQDLNQPLAFGPWLAVSGAVNMFIPWSF